jgi:hypothetical protein
MMARLRDRSTGDLLVLLIAGTICFSVFVGVVSLTITSILAPEVEHPAATAVVADTIQMLVALLAGFLAGRTDTPAPRRPADRGDDDEPPV